MEKRLASVAILVTIFALLFAPSTQAQNAPRNEAILQGLDKLDAREFADGVVLLRKGLETIDTDARRVPVLGIIMQVHFIMEDESAALGVFKEILRLAKETEDQDAKTAVKDTVIPTMTNYLISPDKRASLAAFHSALKDISVAHLSAYNHNAQTGALLFTGSQTTFPEMVGDWQRTGFKQLKPNAFDYLMNYEKSGGLERVDVFVTMHDDESAREAIALTVQVFELKNMLIDSYGGITEQALQTQIPLTALNAAYKVRQGDEDFNTYITTVDVGQWLHKLRATTALPYEEGLSQLNSFIGTYPWPSPGFQALSDDTTCKRKTSYYNAQPAPRFTDLTTVIGLLTISQADGFFEVDRKYMCDGPDMRFGGTVFSHAVDKRKTKKRGTVLQAWAPQNQQSQDATAYFLVRSGLLGMLTKDNASTSKQQEELSRNGAALMSRNADSIDFLELYAEMPTQLQLRSRIVKAMRGSDAPATAVRQSSEAN